MSWLFSRVLVEEFSAANSLDGEPSALLSGNPIPQAYCAPDKMTGFSRLSRFGMTYAPLTESRGQELLTLYLAGFHAKTSVPLGGGLELPALDQDCGKRWQGLLGRYDPATHSLKTAQCSLFEGLTPFSVILPRWGLMQAGELYQRQTLVRHTSERESGLLPTVTATANQLAPSMRKRHANPIWPTPTCNMISGGANHASPSVSAGKHGLNLTGAVAMWPTPTAHNAKETNAPSEALRNEPTLASQVGGHLNPTWVEWLMGWPLGWTDLKPLEMDKFQEWQQQHSNF
jgi:hypothetical protein